MPVPPVSDLLNGIEGAMAPKLLRGILNLSDRRNFREIYLNPALDASLIEMTLPDKPNSRLQQYRLADKGRAWLTAQEKKGRK